jgi:hypothetical protein
MSRRLTPLLRPLLGPLRIETPLGLFSVLWAFGTALNSLENSPLSGLMVYPLVVLLLFNPEQLWAIATFAVMHAILLALRLPGIANHSVLALLVDTGLVIGCLRVWTRRGASGATSADGAQRALWDAVRGPLKATLVLVYAFAVFDKLNRSFFDPTVSCAVSQVGKMLTLHGITGWPADPSVFQYNIYLTLIVETAIVALLLWPRVAYLGATLGLLFHLGLGWARFYDFATLAFALYLFFLPWDRVQDRLSRMRSQTGTLFFVAFAGVALCSVIFYGVLENPVIVPGARWSLTADTLLCLCWTSAVVPMLWPIFRGRDIEADPRRWHGTALAWVVPAIALLNGATPYLGLKTVSNYSMFSNLRTEGGMTNHLLVPAGRFFISDRQNDLVRVESMLRPNPPHWPWWSVATGHSDPRWRAEIPGARIPFSEIRRIVQNWHDLGVPTATVVFERNGERQVVQDAYADAEIMRPMPWLERKLFSYRVVDPDGMPARCRW